MIMHLPQMAFMSHAKKGAWFSVVLTIASLLLIMVRGFNFGLELTGGATIEIQYPQAANITQIRQIVQQIHPEASVIQYGSSQDVQVRFGEVSGRDTEAVMRDMVSALKADAPEIKLLGQSKIGGQYKEELVEKGIAALLLSSLGMVIYLGLRFEWKFAFGAILSQLHDVIVVAALFSLTQWTFDLTILAALLAVLGYSVNDTVVVYDRIRENFIHYPSMKPKDVLDLSINQTLARTIITSLTTLLAVLALAIFGGSTLFGFAIAMIAGIVFGTYSSIFVASSAVYLMNVKHEDLLPRAKVQLDDLP
ncbi:MAG: protein translocase subunit SecF [Cardiobacteriaceae bacterium]|nr:protein translocase subunit SecF [Cardiobacteriaceae bacterium]